MRALIVTTNNYPNNGTCSNIIHNLLFEGNLVNKLDEVAVLCSKSDVSEKDVEIIEGVNVYRVLSWTLIDKNKFRDNISRKKMQIFKALFDKMQYYFVKKYMKGLFVDYPTCRAFYNKLKHLNKKYDIIVSISGRYDATMAVYNYVNKTNQKFILYQVDPCSTNLNYSQNSKKRRAKFELQLYQMASYILTTPIIYIEHKDDVAYRPYYNKIIALEFPVIIPDSKKVKRKNTKIINFMFLGSLYGNARNPNYTLELFSNLLDDNSKLHLVGVNVEKIPKKYQSDNIICYGRQSIEKCKELIDKSDFLVNIGNTIVNQVPSKIFDYISTGKPIVNICESKSCPTIHYLEKYPAVINIIKDKYTISKQVNLIRLFMNEKHDYISNEKIKKTYYECTPEYCANKIFETIKYVNKKEND